MSPKKSPTIRAQVIQILLDHGPLKVADMMPYMTVGTAHSVHSKCLELANTGMMSHDSQMVWTLKPGVTPKTLVTGELQDEIRQEGTDMEDSIGKESPTAGAQTGKALSDEDQFAELVKSTGVDKNMVPTITKQFFNGDIDSLTWLKQVLLRNAAGFVRNNQARVIITSWSQMHHLPYNPDDFPLEEPEKGQGGKASEKEPPKSAAATVIEESGIGYKVVKDRDGDWIPMPGGPLPYQDALVAAQKSNTIKALSSGQPVEGSEEPAEGGGAKTPAKAGKAPRAFQDIFMEKVLDDWIDGKKGRGDEDSPVLRELRDELRQSRQEIKDMKDEQARERLDRIEANLAAIAAHDPWDDPRSIETARQRLGIPSTTVTDNSPAVQLIKDSTDKIDKNMGRLVGIVERAALQSDQFRPEETRTTEQKEEKAEQILSEATRRARSQELRRRTFNV